LGNEDVRGKGGRASNYCAKLDVGSIANPRAVVDRGANTDLRSFADSTSDSDHGSNANLTTSGAPRTGGDACHMPDRRSPPDLNLVDDDLAIAENHVCSDGCLVREIRTLTNLQERQPYPAIEVVVRDVASHVISKENERPAEDANAKRERNSLERLASFTKRMVSVPKTEVTAREKKASKTKS
jgi:hypothetical protein